MNEQISVAVTELAECKCLLDDRDAEFANSLCDQWQKKHRLSDKQVPWVHRLIKKALTQGDDAPDTGVALGNFAKMIALFDKAGAKIKYPKLTFRLPNTSEDVKLVIKRAGAKSKYNGQLMLSDGGPWGDRVYFGRIDLEGVFVPSPSGEEFGDLLIPFLTKFAEDPSGTATGQGHKTGNCCFCHTALSHANSVAAGFGPVCSKNWGLEEEWKNAVKEAK